MLFQFITLLNSDLSVCKKCVAVINIICVFLCYFCSFNVTKKCMTKFCEIKIRVTDATKWDKYVCHMIIVDAKCCFI